jgi:hypothetical protein
MKKYANELLMRLKGQCHEIFCFRFFHESSFLMPLKITLGSFQIFSKILWDIFKSRYTTGSNDTSSKFALYIVGVFGNNDTVIFFNVNNIFMLTLLPKGVQTKYLKLFWSEIFSFVTDVNNTGGAPSMAKTPWIFKIFRNGPNGILSGLGKTDSWKKPVV